MTTDPVADLLTRIRNANLAKHATCDVPASKLKAAVLDVLKREGYIAEYAKLKVGPQGTLRVTLKYSFGGDKALKHIERISKPGCRKYRGVNDFGKVLDGLGIQIISTPKGVKSDKEAKKANVGGEVLARVW
ncbi:MAG: small subunit ribosomal protein [Planctomycetota bacterium]|nr:MAG: small subunit ribosomal protein [Planctomycetota bacterium]